MNITKEEFIIRLKLVVMADERSCVEDITYLSLIHIFCADDYSHM